MTGLGLLTALIVLVLDQATKWWVLNGLHLPARGDISVLPFLNFTMTGNQGVTFGLFQQSAAFGQWLLIGVALLVVVLLIVWMRRAESRITVVALGAITGGALGNLLDRARLGHVTDFIHVHAGEFSWYVFNLADTAIVCGVGVLVLEGLFPRRRARLRP